MIVKKDKVSMSMCDTLGNLSLSGCVNLIQNAVASALGEVDCDNHTLKEKYNAMWVFVRNKVKFFKKLRWNEEFQTESFISSFTKITVIVDILIRNQCGEMVFYAQLEVCPLDCSTHKIRRNTSVGIEADTLVSPSEMKLDLLKYTENTGIWIKEVTVESQNIDYSKHTNNAEYMRFVLNTFTVSELEHREVSELDIQYIKESKEGDYLAIYKNEFEKRDSFQIMRGNERIAQIVLTYKE